jgi:hypothetical protein
MDLLEDYLRAVSRLLPAAKRDDIIAELRDEILTRIETKEETLGRALTPDETEQLLRDFGHPIVVAARYRDEPQYAVGPTLYPFWIFAIRLAIVIQIGISALVFLGRVISGSHVGDAFGAAIGAGVTGVVTLIGFATIAAWLIERNKINIDYFNTWRVRDLRFLDFADWDWTKMDTTMHSGDKRAYGLGHAAPDRDWTMRRSAASRGIGSIVGAVITILWWVGIIRFGLTGIDPATATVIDFGGLTEVDWPAFKAEIYWPVIAYFGAIMAFGAAVLIFPRAVRLRGAIDIAVGASLLGIVGWVWFASPIAPIVSVATLSELGPRISAMVSQPLPLDAVTIATISLLFTALGGVFRVLFGIWEVLTGIPRPDADH